MLFKLSYLNSNLALTLGYLNPALKNSAQVFKYQIDVCITELGGLLGPRNFQLH